MESKPLLAVLGGTGDLGSGLTLRWAMAGYRVIIGSREREKSTAACGELRQIVVIRGQRILGKALLDLQCGEKLSDKLMVEHLVSPVQHPLSRCAAGTRISASKQRIFLHGNPLRVSLF